MSATLYTGGAGQRRIHLATEANGRAVPALCGATIWTGTDVMDAERVERRARKVSEGRHPTPICRRCETIATR